MIKLYNDDCLSVLKKLPAKSVDLCVTDPPYNMKIAKWDSWKTNKAYVDFMKNVFYEVSRVLKDNGSLYFFHIDMELIAMLMEMIRSDLPFTFNSFLIWDKGIFRSLAWKNPSDKNKLRSWFNTCEFCLYYTKGESKTGWETICLDTNNFKSLRKYAYDLMQFIGLSGGGLNKGSDTEKQNISSIAKKKVLQKIGGRGDHFTRYGSSQWALCTEDVYNELISVFHIDKWQGFREYESLRQEYESLRQEYESLRPTHNLSPEHNNVFRYNSPSSNRLHICQKPVELIEEFILCSSNKNDTVLDCFMGSGTTGIAAKKLDRHFIGIENNPETFKIAEQRLSACI